MRGRGSGGRREGKEGGGGGGIAIVVRSSSLDSGNIAVSIAAILQHVIVLQGGRVGGRGRGDRREIRRRGRVERGGQTYLRLRATWTTIRGTNAIAPVHDPGLPCLNHTRPAVRRNERWEMGEVSRVDTGK